MKCPKSGFFVQRGESGKAILQVSVAVFFGYRRNIFRAKMAQPPLGKIGPYAYATVVVAYGTP